MVGLQDELATKPKDTSSSVVVEVKKQRQQQPQPKSKQNEKKVYINNTSYKRSGYVGNILISISGTLRSYINMNCRIFVFEDKQLCEERKEHSKIGIMIFGRRS